MLVIFHPHSLLSFPQPENSLPTAVHLAGFVTRCSDQEKHLPAGVSTWLESIRHIREKVLLGSLSFVTRKP